MSIAEDFTNALSPWETPDQDAFAQAIGGMFAEVELYAAEPDEPDEIPIYVDRRNWCPTPSFNLFTAGGYPGQWRVPIVDVSRGERVDSFTVEAGWSKVGALSLWLNMTLMAGDIGLADHTPQPVVPGDLVSMAAWFNVQNSSAGFFSGDFYAQPVVGVRFFDSTGSAISTITVDGVDPMIGAALQRVVFPSVSVPAGAVSVSALVGLQNQSASDYQAVTTYIDAIQLYTDGPCPSEFVDGDQPGYEWVGIPGASPTAPAFALPRVGWSIMLDVDTCPTNGLPYLAQWAGERLPAGISDAAARAWIRAAPNQYRGTPSAIAQGVKRHLTGTQTVFMRERSDLTLDPDPDQLAILTYAHETPNVALVRAELRKVAPADIQVDYGTVTAASWATLEAAYPTWAALEAANATWIAAEALRPGQVPAGFEVW